MGRTQEVASISAQLARLGFNGWEVADLIRVSQSLNRAGVRRCNEPLDEAQDRRLALLEARREDEARKIAERHGCRCYFQGDPRGAALYILPGEKPDPERPDGSYYSSIGIAVY